MVLTTEGAEVTEFFFVSKAYKPLCPLCSLWLNILRVAKKKLMWLNETSRSEEVIHSVFFLFASLMVLTTEGAEVTEFFFVSKAYKPLCPLCSLWLNILRVAKKKLMWLNETSRSEEVIHSVFYHRGRREHRVFLFASLMVLTTESTEVFFVSKANKPLCPLRPLW
jgi:predicted DCC family thiol-disulfide oxidoreductase YuxK